MSRETPGSRSLRLCEARAVHAALLRCTATAPACIDAPLRAAILSVYTSVECVPVDAALKGSAEAQRVVRAITSVLGLIGVEDPFFN